ncbi:Aste57867_17970 [Aphanomyces stellatus]|uniref:Aste57867_17970 protein n=1 Tax=Aphanomyces stellatus TaxID=120398 RepID=A0A485L971_9STRA|nr:hypothetical protein As57867_017908 [Aphanomyces stellatus]VFT94710.1 Aste57867_17970 [Aphanomyces stellatus]
MVHIINGEIVQDNDPRVQARKRNSAAPASNIGGFGRPAAGGAQQRGGPPTGTPQQAPAGGNAAPNPLSQVASAIGMEGTVLIPAVPALSFRSVAVEKIYLIIFAVLVIMVGWRALAFGAIGYFIYQHQLNQPNAP